MIDQVLQTLHDLRTYAIGKGYEIEFLYQEENGSLMRFANSAISLNTSEHLIRLNIQATLDRRQASVGLITDLSRADDIKGTIDMCWEMVQHSQPLTYQPTVPTYRTSFTDESAFDRPLAEMSSEQKLAYFNEAALGLESPELKLSGIFSSGSNTIALMNTRSDHSLYFRTSDAQVTAVLAHAGLKWELIAEQSAQAAPDLDPAALHRELSFLADRFESTQPSQLPLGAYDIIFGPAAIAEMLGVMNWVGFDGGLMKRGYSFLQASDLGRQVFSPLFTLIDDPDRLETFPFRVDFTGIPRRPWPIVDQGTFRGFLWSQDSADEFGATPTGHTVAHKSLAMGGGDAQACSLPDLVAKRRDRDALYVPFLHYMNVVNPTKGLITASSRFGALLLRKDGSVGIPFNVRLTQSLLDIFGGRVEWLTQTTLPYNTTHSYGARNPVAIIVPRYMQVHGLEVSHSNPSF
ncbi:MAG TPA: metallopeptidase TldD-related protein [Anaerolineae bacterium]|nr:metallopeptidase TldD-related protein [Anaerolineae bacterium]